PAFCGSFERHVQSRGSSHTGNTIDISPHEGNVEHCRLVLHSLGRIGFTMGSLQAGRKFTDLSFGFIRGAAALFGFWRPCDRRPRVFLKSDGFARERVHGPNPPPSRKEDLKFSADIALELFLS